MWYCSGLKNEFGYVTSSEVFSYAVSVREAKDFMCDLTNAETREVITISVSNIDTMLDDILYVEDLRGVYHFTIFNDLAFAAFKTLKHCPELDINDTEVLHI